jgi:hypothetical protein
MSNTHIVYTSHSGTTEAELSALAAVYKFVLFDSQASKGGPHDVATNGRKQKVQGKTRKDRT